MKFDIVRAWKDAEYRQNLSAEEQAVLPDSPAGELELTDDELNAIYGGCGCSCSSHNNHSSHSSNGNGNGGGNSNGSSTFFAVNSNAQASLLGLVTGICANSAASFGSCNGF